MEFNDVYILVTILAICSIGLTLSSLSYFRNIYTQKIIFLNKQLTKLNTEEDIIEYRISEFREFNINIKGGELYPPTVRSRFLINTEYNSLVEKHQKHLRLTDKYIRLIVWFYFSSMVLVGIVHIIS